MRVLTKKWLPSDSFGGKIIFLTCLIVVFYLLVVAKLFSWQVLRGREITNQIGRQNTRESYYEGRRGAIISVDGRSLSENIIRYNLWTDPQVAKKNVAEKVIALSARLDLSRPDLQKIFDKTDTRYVTLAKRLTKDQMDNIKLLEVEGLGFDQEQLRIYPEASSSSHVTGFLGKDDGGKSKGYFGLEGYYDLVLRGKESVQKFKVDALGRRIETSTDTLQLDGATLLTSIDLGIQVVAEKKLLAGIEKYGAVSGNVVIMDSKTGNVLAMVAAPSFDPNRYWEFDNILYKNPIVSDSFEPGSVFKVVVMASALDQKAVDKDTKCDICDKAYKIDKYQIETWNDEYYPDSSMTEVIVHSDNVGMVYVANKLGKKDFYAHLLKFGFGEATGIDVQGEFFPKLKNYKDWSDVDLATISFGQGIAVTPMQMIRAVGAIANKGVIQTPQIGQKILMNQGEVKEIKKENSYRVISKEAAEKITAMMVEAASSGEAQWTNLPGFGVAGKTGTAQIPIAGHYDDKKTIASFVGFAPYDDPRFVMLVTLREPKSSQWASETAAPLWYDIASDLFIKFGISPER